MSIIGHQTQKPMEVIHSTNCTSWWDNPITRSATNSGEKKTSWNSKETVSHPSPKHVFRVPSSSTMRVSFLDISVLPLQNEELLGVELELGSGLSALVVECDCGSAVFSPLRGFRHLPMGLGLQKKHNKKVSPWRQKLPPWTRNDHGDMMQSWCM